MVAGGRFRARRPILLATVALLGILLTPACTSAVPAERSPSRTTTAATSTPVPIPPLATRTAPRRRHLRHRRPHPITSPTSTMSSTAPQSISRRPTPQRRPVIVLDPGHSVAISATDPANGLDVSDYENEPEMGDVFAVAQIVARQLRAAGYRVVMTKKSLDQPTSLLDRVQVANRVHADLALSIHDQAGSSGGIGFNDGNNIVYYQSVGGYRVSDQGNKVVFRNRRVAHLSREYGHIFQTERAAREHHSVVLQGDTGYDLGGRGLAGGDMWMVQLLSHVPWIYNEAGGNSAGRVGLSRRDKRLYADGLVASVEHCIRPPR